MHIVHPTPEQVAALRSMRFHHPCPAARRRSEIVLLAAHFVAYGKMAGILGVCPNTVANTLAAFESGGIEGLTFRRASGTDSEPAAFDFLMREHWGEHPPGTVREAYGAAGGDCRRQERCDCGSRFHEASGLKRRKAGRKVFRERRFRRSKGCLSGKSLSRACRPKGGDMWCTSWDAPHFAFGAFLGYVWCFVRVFIRTAPSRQRCNVIGAVDVIGGALLTARSLIGGMPELGRINRNEAAALAGLAPFPRDSGMFVASV